MPHLDENLCEIAMPWNVAFMFLNLQIFKVSSRLEGLKKAVNITKNVRKEETSLVCNLFDVLTGSFILNNNNYLFLTCCYCLHK